MGNHHVQVTLVNFAFRDRHPNIFEMVVLLTLTNHQGIRCIHHHTGLISLNGKFASTLRVFYDDDVIFTMVKDKVMIIAL